MAHKKKTVFLGNLTIIEQAGLQSSYEDDSVWFFSF
jgi:hypothetical protein